MARAARQLELAGVFASAITPRHLDSRDPDFSGLLDLLDFLSDGGVRGVCLFGPEGEFFNYSFAERQRLLYLGAKRSRVPLLVGVSHSTFAGAVQLADEALTSGADGLILIPPYFFPYRPTEIEAFYVQFAKETGDAIPILIHNLPQSTSKLEPDLMRSLIDTGRFAGINDSSGDWRLFELLLEIRHTRPFALFAGNDRIAAKALRAGANGVISGTACALPELFARLENADAVARLEEFLDRAGQFPYPNAIKRALQLRGQKSAPPLTPPAPETERALAEFDIWFKRFLL